MNSGLHLWERLLIDLVALVMVAGIAYVIIHVDNRREVGKILTESIETMMTEMSNE